MTQNEQIVAYIHKYGSITQAQAASDLSCYRLGARIFELKRSGVQIITENVTKRNAAGHVVNFARYRIADGSTV